MPIKLSDEVRTQFDTNLSTIKKFNAKDLIRRDELGSELNFADAETDFETAINLFKGLADIDIMRVPESIIRDLNNEMSTFINSMLDGKIDICDFGLTLMRLSYTYDLTTRAKQTIFNKILRENGADIENGNIFISSSINNMYATIMQFVQLIAKISDMKQYQRLSQKSEFYNNFKDFILDSFKEFSPKANIIPIPDREEITVDYVLQQSNCKPIYLYPVSGNSKADLVVMSFINLQKANIPFTGVVVHEDFESLAKKTQKFITDAADKQFTDFSNFKSQGSQYLNRLTTA